MKITESNINHGFTQYDNSRYIETVCESNLNKINTFINSKLNVLNHKGFIGDFYLEIEVKLISRKRTQVIGGEYNGIYFEQITTL